MDPQGNFLRMGLYNSGGTAASSHTDTVFGDDEGYLADATYYSSQFGFALREEGSIDNSFTEILLDTIPTRDIFALGSDTTKVSDNGSNFRMLSLRISYDGSQATTDVFYDDPTFSGIAANSQTDGVSPVSTFDSFFIRAAGSFGSAEFQIEKITVAVTPVPEPAHYGMVVAGLLLTVALRRRAKLRAAECA